ncbi:hypothetical protein NUU61_000665 [Penicillium alfredii]|uniref:Uncharacterized protein n=1 Tax=Penicillium alfredii TaxID=1506179 RepID=A0A9W9GA69_9EURO|nr:uncharacterized protein NUU61_000665 [Penicillium alfredii]KAJ5114906.1 hypothetical protein NUU61_000665 [Penicillium alfredii]
MDMTKRASASVQVEGSGQESERGSSEAPSMPKPRMWSRETYSGSLIFNLGAFFLPALYSTLSKLWVARIDASQVVTTDVYTYIGVIIEVLNEGLPRSAWLVIGDKTTRTIHARLNLAYTMIVAQVVLGTVMTIIFLGANKSLAGTFVPAEVRQTSLTYVRLSSVQALTSAMEAAIAASTRALDNPDVPLIISSSKFLVNIVLDFLVISKFHVGTRRPSVITQAIIRLVCDAVSALVGLFYFIYVVVKHRKQEAGDRQRLRLTLSALSTLARPSVYTFLESALRNAIYLWLVKKIIQLGTNYATAWGVFSTIRWGLVMVPVQALEASTLTFVGHNWGQFRGRTANAFSKAARADLLEITRPALVSCAIALAFETVFCIALSWNGIEGFAFYLSESEVVAEIAQKMWKASKPSGLI